MAGRSSSPCRAGGGDAGARLDLRAHAAFAPLIRPVSTVRFTSGRRQLMSMRNAVFGVAAVLCSAVGLHAQIPGSPYLKDLAAAHNVELGVTVQGGHLTNDSAYATFARQNFGVL